MGHGTTGLRMATLDWRTMITDMERERRRHRWGNKIGCSTTLLEQHTTDHWLPKGRGNIPQRKIPRRIVFIVMIMSHSIPANIFYSILFYSIEQVS